MRVLVVSLLAALALAPAAGAGGPRMLVGAVENDVLQGTPQRAQVEGALARNAGLAGAIRVELTWARGTTTPSAATVTNLQSATAAAASAGALLYALVYPYGSSQTPLSAADQAQFAGWVAAIARAVPGETTSSSATSRT